MSDRRKGLFWVMLVAGGVLPHSASAQALYGSLVGNLADPSGGAVAGARIHIAVRTVIRSD